MDRHVDASPEPDKLQKILGVVAVLLPLMGVFAAFSFLFVLITAEKQNRLGEQLLSAVGARRWLDGKLIGLTALSLEPIFTTGLLLSAVLLVVQKFSDKPTDAPDATGVVALSIAPITNTAFMPMRLALSDVPLWQVLLSVAAIILSIAVMRWVAQRVLKMAMVMYGQEPTYGEIVQML